MTVHDIRSKFLNFFAAHQHIILPSAPLVPENDPTTLFICAGVHPLVPFILQGSHPLGSRLASVQKCVRTDDINEVGDSSHQTFFEMLGNWSIGDYFKKEAISWSFEFLTSQQWLKLKPEKIYVTVFSGDRNTPRDDESFRIWQKTFSQVGLNAETGKRISFYSREKNWWGPAGKTGPCGPDTEIFYDTGQKHNAKFGKNCHPNCECGRFVELWNIVFMEYFLDGENKLTPLKQKNVDTGMGLERLMRVLDQVPDNYATQLFRPLMNQIREKAGQEVEGEKRRSARIVADHLRAAVFLIADQVRPGKVEQGSVLRRLIRRAIRQAKLLSIESPFLDSLAKTVIEIYQESYPELGQFRQEIENVLAEEEDRFGQSLDRGLRYFSRLTSEPDVKNSKMISGVQAFNLYQSYGFPIELTEELAAEHGFLVDRLGFDRALVDHQQISRLGMEKKFTGGLADHTLKTTKLHTATHLLYRALRQILGEDIYQAGSNITQERLRFDFTYSSEIAPEEIKQIENNINQKIKDDLPITAEVVLLPEARRRGAIGLRGKKYNQRVKIYTIGDPKHPWSVELCGGPHVRSTREIGTIKITKEKSVGSDIRRIYATLKDFGSA